MAQYLKSKYSSRDQGDLSQPTPDCFTPACGVCSVPPEPLMKISPASMPSNALAISFALWPKK